MNTVSNTNRIAFPVKGDHGLDAEINPHFGHSAHYIITDATGEELQHIAADILRLPNECAPISGLIALGAKKIVCKSMGQGAYARCKEAGLSVERALANTIRGHLENVRSNTLNHFSEKDLCTHGGRCDHEHPDHHHH